MNISFYFTLTFLKISMNKIINLIVDKNKDKKIDNLLLKDEKKINENKIIKLKLTQKEYDFLKEQSEIKRLKKIVNLLKRKYIRISR